MRLLEGELPASTDECALETDFMEAHGLNVGDTIEVGVTGEELQNALVQKTFRVTGRVMHPDHYLKVWAMADNRYVLVVPDVFDTDALSDRVMAALVTIDKPQDVGIFSGEYRKLASEAYAALDAAAGEIGERGTAEIRDTFNEKISDAEKQLSEGEEELSQARSEIDENRQKLHDAELELARGREKLDSAKAQLEAAKDELASAQSQLETGKKELDSGKRKLDDAKWQLEDGFRKIGEVKNQILDTVEATVREKAGDETADRLEFTRVPLSADVNDPATSAMRFDVSDGFYIQFEGTEREDTEILLKTVRGLIRVADEALADEIVEEIRNSDVMQGFLQFVDALKDWETGHEKYLDGLNDYRAARSEYNAGLKKYEDGKAQYEKALADYEKGEADYAAALEQFNDGSDQFEKGLEQYNDGVEEYDRASAQLEESRGLADSLPSDNVYVYGHEGNLSYNSVSSSADNLRKTARTFSMLFVIIAALVIFATIGRIVGEQRNLIGTQKALGFYRREIYVKYLSFAMLSTATGMLIGIAVGYFLMQPITLSAQCRVFIPGMVDLAFDAGITAALLGGGLVMAFAVTMISCRSLVRKNAKELLQAEMPKKTGAKGRGRASHGSLYSRLIRRNIRSEIGRVVITVISVAGCCILLCTGLYMRDSIFDTINRQFEQITMYDVTVYYKAGDEDARERIAQVLESDGVTYANAYISTRIIKNGASMNAIELMCLPDGADGLIDIRDHRNGEEMELPGFGIVIQNKFSSYYGIERGDCIRIVDDSMALRDVYVTGIENNYIGRTGYMSEKAYETAFGAKPAYNAFLVGGVEDTAALQDALSAVEGFDRATLSADTRDSFISLTSSLDSIIMILVLAAGLMAVFVLLNLVSMHLNNKKRELTVMRINGFTTREVINYVLKEAVVTTILGIILGVILGQVLGNVILRTIEQPQVVYYQKFSLSAVLISAGLTAVYSGVIYFIATRKIKNLKLSDI